MIRKPVLFAVASSLLFCSGCAAKNRWFSRKDYQEMQDPFMESDAVASDDSSDSRLDAAANEGRATLGGSKASADSGKSILPTGVSVDRGAASVGSTDKNVTKSYQGPALSDFLGKKAGSAEPAATSAQVPAGIADAAAATARPAGTSPSAAASRTVSPAARAAALPDLSHEVEGFNQFLQDGSAAVTTKATQMTTAATQMTTATKEKVEQPVGDFASWATQEQQRWNTAAGNANAAASSATNASVSAMNTMKTASKNAAATAKAAVIEEAEFGSAEFEEMATAEPLVKRPTRAASSFEPEFSAAEKPASDLEENPFDEPFATPQPKPVARKPVTPKTAPNPQDFSFSAEEEPSEVSFDEPQPKPVIRKPAPAKTAKKSLDSSFQMDSGWKPANLETP